MGLFNKTPPPPPPRTYIAAGASIQGDLTTRANVEIEGKVSGTVRTDAVLRILAGGALEGSAECRRIECGGTLEGTIRSSELTVFGETAVWRGDLRTPKLFVMKGARLQGRLQESPK